MNTNNKDSVTLIKIKDLTKLYPIQRGFWSKTTGHIQALKNINLEINSGEVLGIVGESGCGKSTLGKLILALIEPTSGEVYYKGKNIFLLSKKDLRLLRERIQIVFQNPYSILNPRMKIKDIIKEPIIVHKQFKNKKDLENKMLELLNIVGLEEEHKEKYPHELSGGQRQRIAIARAISLKPEFLVLDEPVSALDVSVQAQILNLLSDLQKKLRLTYIFISHNLSVVSYLSDKIAVMYLGNIVEFGAKEDIINSPQHPYTKVLISAVPKVGALHATPLQLIGDIPDPSNVPSGCAFRTRCPIAQEKCKLEIPKLGTHNKQLVSCYFPGTL